MSHLPSRIPLHALIGLLLMAVAVAACGTTATTGGINANGGNVIHVVAAENFWGNIASQVGGGHVKVTSIITDPNADPHSYAPVASDAITVATAQYVIVNGAGYDPWATKLLTANPVSGRITLNVGDFNGKHAGDNPHMWYSPDYITAVATKMRDDLKRLDPGDASAFDQSAQAFLMSGLQQYHSLISDIKTKYSHVPVGATESIFAYLAPALGLNLITPATFLKAVSEGEDISAADEATVEQQIDQKQIKVLIYNSQNTPNNIQALITKAKAANIPIATITETLSPATDTFEQWQVRQLQGIASALAQATGN